MSLEEDIEARGFGWAHRELASDNLKVILNNGFDAPTWENMLNKLMLVITEIDEAIDALTGGGEDPLDEELADIWIRLSGILAALWPEDWAVRYENLQPGHRYHSVEELLWPIATMCCKAAEAWRKDKRDDTRMWLEYAIKETVQAALTFEVDLWAAVEAKLIKNRNRPKFHGKAKSSG